MQKICLLEIYVVSLGTKEIEDPCSSAEGLGVFITINPVIQKLF